MDEIELQGLLQRAMRKGEVVEGEVVEGEVVVGEGTDVRRSTLLLNGAKIATAVAVELVKPPPAFRLLWGQYLGSGYA